jgi:hypothetical protein
MAEEEWTTDAMKRPVCTCMVVMNSIHFGQPQAAMDADEVPSVNI